MTRVHALSALVVFVAACAPETVSLQASDDSAAPAAATAPARRAGGEDAPPWTFRISGLVWQAGRLRAGPGADHAAVDTVDANTPVTVLATRDTWYRVKLDRTEGPAEGWIPFDRVAVGYPVGDAPALALGAVIVKAVNLRAGPSVSTAVASRLPGRAVVTILGRRENWYRVAAARDGVTLGGWVRADFAVVDVGHGARRGTSGADGRQRGAETAAPNPGDGANAGRRNQPTESIPCRVGGPGCAPARRNRRPSGGGLGSLAPAGTAGTPGGGCGGDIGGAWESASGRTILDLDAAGETGALKSRQGRYRAVTPFTWSATADSITVTYTAPTRFYETGTGKKVDFEKASKGGTVHCAFTGNTLTVGGVAYRRQ